MRKKLTFLLTVLPTEDQQPALRGRLQCIAAGTTFSFTNFEELQQIINNEIQPDETSGSHNIQEVRSSYRVRPAAYPPLTQED